MGTAVADPATKNGSGTQEPIGDPDEIVVKGNTELALFDAGGKKPTGASLSLTGGKVLLADGKAIEKGTVIHGTFTAVVHEVGQKDKHDPKTQRVVDCEQKHKARLTDVTITSFGADD
jgi:hypothetical protein